MHLGSWAKHILRCRVKYISIVTHTQVLIFEHPLNDVYALLANRKTSLRQPEIGEVVV